VKKKDAFYYVPEHSQWPIIGALALLFLAFGSLNIGKKWGLIALIIGVAGLAFMLTGWFWNVAQERQAGFYSPQMDKTFRWGMVWFLIAELFLFGLLLGSIVHVRFSITPWLAGQGGDASQLTHYLLWPDFAKQWPLLTPPRVATHQVKPVHSLLNDLPLINLIVLLASAFCLSAAHYHFKKINGPYCRLSFNLAICFAFIFVISQFYYFIHSLNTHVITQRGVWGSFLIAFLGFHLLNCVAALFFLLFLYTRYCKNAFEKNIFSFDASVWWWDFLTIIWVFGFFLIF